MLAGTAFDSEGLQHRFQPLPRVRQSAARGNLQHPARTVSDRLGVAIVSLSQHNSLKLCDRPVKDVVDQNIAVIAIILNFLPGFAQAAVDFLFIYNPFGAASIA